jgi:hypothetical protein
MAAFVGAACLLAWMPASLAEVVLQTNLPGVTVEGTELLVALPIQNAGNSTALHVTVTEIALDGDRLDSPARLPVQLGTINPNDSPILNLRFAMLNPSRTFTLEIEGRFSNARDADDRERRDRDGDRDRNRDRDDSHEFHIRRVIHVPPAAPGSATVGSNKVTTNNARTPR